MRRAYRIFRASVISAICLCVAVPTLVYVLLSVPAVQGFIRHKCEDELSRQLGVEVTIGNLNIRPFNRAELDDINLVNDNDTLAFIGGLSAGVDVWALVSRGDITVNYAAVEGMRAYISRDSLSSPLNIQPIIDRLANKDKKKPPSRFDLKINTVVIRDAEISYDVKSEPHRGAGLFDPHHIHILSLRADATLPLIKNDNFDIELKRMDFRESSGLRLDNFTGHVAMNPHQLSWSGLSLKSTLTKINLSDGSLQYDSIPDLKRSAMTNGVNVEILPGSSIYPPAIAMFFHQAADYAHPINFTTSIFLSSDSAAISGCNISNHDGSAKIAMQSAIISYPLNPDSLTFDIPVVDIKIADTKDLPRHWFARIPVKSPETINLRASAAGSLVRGEAKVNLITNRGGAKADLDYERHKSTVKTTAHVGIEELDLASILDNENLGPITATADISASIGSRHRNIAADVSIPSFIYRRHKYDKVTLVASLIDDDFKAKVRSFDTAALFSLDGEGSLAKNVQQLNVNGSVSITPQVLNLSGASDPNTYCGDFEGHLSGFRPDRGEAKVKISNLMVLDSLKSNQPLFSIGDIVIESDSRMTPREITIKSDFINGHVTGDYDFLSLHSAVKDILSKSIPGMPVAPISVQMTGAVNQFQTELTIDNIEPIERIFKLPVSLVYPATIKGEVDSSEGLLTLDVSVPYVRQGNKLIEDTRLEVDLNADKATHSLNLLTRYPSADGLTTYKVSAEGEDNVTDTKITWHIDRERRYDGLVHFVTDINADNRGQLTGRADIKKSQLAFNDSVWTIHPAAITFADNVVDVNNINVSRDNQYVKIDGRGSVSPDDHIDIDILNFDLGYLFEAIGIENFQLGGIATGSVTAAAVLSPIPQVSTDGIHVDDISFNKCVLGEATVTSNFDIEQKAVAINGLIKQPNGKEAIVNGELMPFTSELDFRIHADQTNVAFMQHYMKAFASDISGLGSGDFRVFGTFHDVDLEGDVYAENLKLKLNFTNTYYTATDSIHIVPGLINLSHIKLHDSFGHTALLNGVVTHDFFRNPKFRFAVTDINNMLVYNEPAAPNADWYGKIFASGRVDVDGDDNQVKINIDVATDQGSMFTFVLSELEVADEYTFLTFRDKNAPKEPVVVEVDEKMDAVNHLRQLLSKKSQSSTARYLVELKVDVTPDIEVDLVMDPVAGDKIRSHGSGNLRILYTSADNDLRIFGTYRLNRGDYNFTLQDIIIKDFVIKEGSTLSFTGDPLAARLNIEAYYALNANLTDLDESFALDKELNRTNVPVHALLKVTGDIRQPEIAFDLEFPTLTSDIDRKVRSIVSTDEMMNRQIIYLLVLNRFYTPDYMSTTKGDELFSVASSTISSQLSNMLGQLSDKWMISPNFRSDKGGFSDMEVDLALSSRLLNNRLLLNGNFGYRDKTLNTNQFIGDFDIEYLLNKSGTIRLKAYNHYNDQNYYVRTANTTQGVGVMLKQDFDNIFGFLRKKPKRIFTEDMEPDSITSSSESSVTPLSQDSVPAATDDIQPK